MTDLNYDVFVSEGLARQRPDRLPDGGPIVSSPLTSTLILGERDVVLVDAPYTYDQIRKVGDSDEQRRSPYGHNRYH